MTTSTNQAPVAASQDEAVKNLHKHLYKTHQKHQWVGGIPILYLMIVVADLTRDQVLRSMLYFMLPYTIATTLQGAYHFRTITQHAFEERPNDPPGARLARILKIPGKLELAIALPVLVFIFSFIGGSALMYHKSLWTVPWTIMVVMPLVMLVTIQERVVYQRELHPYALREFYKYPKVALTGESGFLWPRQRWYLAYAFGLFVASTLMITVTVIGRQALNAYEQLLSLTNRGGSLSAAEFSQMLTETVSVVSRDAVVPIVLLGIYLGALAGISAWRLAKHQAEGMNAVRDAMEAMARGAPKLPEWVSTDEVGDLSFSTANAFEELKAFSLSLGNSAQALIRSAEDLGMSTSKQSEVITLQATALQETQVTAQEIKQTSVLAAQKAESVLQQTEQADQISHAGENAIQRSLNGLQEIGDQVREMARRIKALEDRTRQIANITTTVKDLADQSNMLALNAAIEAVRSGEHGKGFGVVAREIRALADQSIQATNSVREILQDISNAIRSTVAITEKGSEKIETSLVQVREFGTNIRQLSGIVRDNAAAVRQITAAVTQQNAGIGQIFQAVSDLSKLMDQTVSQLRASDGALVLVRNVTDQVSRFVGNYGWEEMQGGKGSQATKQ